MCGDLTAPARFYWDGEKELSQEKAEAAYLVWLGEHNPERYEGLASKRSPVVRRTAAQKSDSCVSQVGGAGRKRRYGRKSSGQ